MHRMYWTNLMGTTSITQNTAINIGIVASIIAAVFWLATTLAEIKASQDLIRKDLVYLQEKIDAKAADRWSLTMQIEWCNELKTINSNLNVPSPNKISYSYPVNVVSKKE